MEQSSGLSGTRGDNPGVNKAGSDCQQAHTKGEKETTTTLG